MLKTSALFKSINKLSNDIYIVNSFTLVQKPLAFELYGLITIVFHWSDRCEKTFIGIVIIIRIKIILKFFNLIQIFYDDIYVYILIMDGICHVFCCTFSRIYAGTTRLFYLFWYQRTNRYVWHFSTYVITIIILYRRYIQI